MRKCFIWLSCLSLLLCSCTRENSIAISQTSADNPFESIHFYIIDPTSGNCHVEDSTFSFKDGFNWRFRIDKPHLAAFKAEAPRASLFSVVYVKPGDKVSYTIKKVDSNDFEDVYSMFFCGDNEYNYNYEQMLTQLYYDCNSFECLSDYQCFKLHKLFLSAYKDSISTDFYDYQSIDIDNMISHTLNPYIRSEELEYNPYSTTYFLVKNQQNQTIQKQQREIIKLSSKVIPDSILDNTMCIELKTMDTIPLRRVLSYYEGRPIYCDWWNSYCVPCRKNIRSSSQIKKHLQENGVSVVYFSTDKEITHWSKISGYENITEDQYLIIDEWDSMLGMLFEYAVVPQYFLLDSEHNIASLDVPSLIDENEDKIMKLLESIGVSAKVD